MTATLKLLWDFISVFLFLPASTNKSSSEPKLKEADTESKEQLLTTVGKAVFPAEKCTDKGIVVTFHAVECTRILHPTLQAVNFPSMNNSEIIVEVAIEPTGKKPSSKSRKEEGTDLWALLTFSYGYSISWYLLAKDPTKHDELEGNE
ncbi:hypothetical protein V6N13_140215 [Hibiscus sabdariffa]|uniref:Uncharacterized protein n=1 Tax=Hibiscus sabdariffa TaxID=183260 RepID=A0ABR2QAT0_9ROSI